MRFRYIRIILNDIILLPLFLFCIFNASLVTYGLRMGKGQLDIVMNAKQIDDVLVNPALEKDVRYKLELIQRIRQFAFDSIGLKPVDNYTTYFDQKGQRLLYVVTASERFELKAYQWHFPWLGDVPYKGFFDEEKAKEEHERLKLLGYDVDIGGASGWSTLGWFKDPVLSSMLKRSEGDLAELIIHELTHGTIYVKDSADYNENLAQFVGVEGAKWFLRAEYGDSSVQLAKYIASLEDEEIRTEFMLAQSRYLDSVYHAFSPAADVLSKQYRKHVAFAVIVERARKLDLKSDTTFASRIKRKLKSSGNTMFMSYIRYEGKKDDFSAEFKASGKNLRVLVDEMKLRYGKAN